MCQLVGKHSSGWARSPPLAQMEEVKRSETGQAGGAGKEQVGVEGLGEELALVCHTQCATLPDDSAMLLCSLLCPVSSLNPK